MTGLLLGGLATTAYADTCTCCFDNGSFDYATFKNLQQPDGTFYCGREEFRVTKPAADLRLLATGDYASSASLRNARTGELFDVKIRSARKSEGVIDLTKVSVDN